jgi:dihydrodipicolinate synthase/N-acetylneuraminate lyase
MPTPPFRGIVPMQVTPFDRDGGVDLDSLAATIAWQVELGVTDLSALGMAGEFFKLATDEIEAVISTIVEASGPGRTLLGVSAGSAEVAARLARHAAAAGADGLLVLPPFGIKPGADELIAYYAAIARASDLPIMAQDGSDEIRAVIPFDVLVRLCREVSNVTYIKVEDVAPSPKISRLGETLGAGVTLLCGSGGLDILDAYDRGAVGCISGAATADLFLDLDRAYHDDRATAERRYDALLPLIQFQCQSSELFVATEKRILRQRGLIASERVRHPGYALDEGQQKRLDSLYAMASPDGIGRA